MAPDVTVMRSEVGKMYPGPKWKRRVSRMSDEQITAIYLRKQSEPEQAEPDEKEQPDGGNTLF